MINLQIFSLFLISSARTQPCAAGSPPCRGAGGAGEPSLRNNPGKDGVLFTDQHPMIAKVKPAMREKVEKAIIKTIQNIKTVEIENWIKSNVPEKGDFLTLPNFKSNGITIFRKSVRGIADHFADPHLKDIAMHVHSIVKSAKYLDHAPLKQGINTAEKSKYIKKKARGVTGYNYYSFMWRGEQYRLNVEIVNGKEYIYAINKIINAG